MSTTPNPLIANFLAQQNPAVPTLGNAMSMPGSAPSMGSPALPSVSLAPPPPPTQTQTDQATRNHLINSGDGVSQIHNPLLRGIARAADIAGTVFAPGLAMAIPGTMLHHDYLVNQATSNVVKDQAQDQAAATITGTQARTADELATADATNENVAASRRAAQKAAVSGNILYDENKNPIGYQDGAGKYYGLKDPSLPAGVGAVLANVKPKTPTSEFELWHQQNPNGTAADFQQVQSKPLSAQEAASLNSVWDSLATKHHLPTGQFAAGMPHADATQLASALNSAIGKQQGDTHVSISLQGLQNQQTKNAPIDTSDPAMQASIAAVAKGDLKLSDVFGRGATTTQKAQFAAAVKEVNPNYNSGDHDVENAVRRDFTSGHDSNTLNAVNTAYKHLDTFAQAATALNNGDVKSMNEFANAMGVQVQNGASPQVVSGLVKEALKGEVARALTGAGATVDEQRNIDSSFSNANSLKTMLAVANEAKTLLKGKQDTLRTKFDSGSSGKPNFIDDSQKVDGHWDPVAKKVVYH